MSSNLDPVVPSGEHNFYAQCYNHKLLVISKKPIEVIVEVCNSTVTSTHRKRWLWHSQGYSLERRALPLWNNLPWGMLAPRLLITSLKSIGVGLSVDSILVVCD